LGGENCVEEGEKDDNERQFEGGEIEELDEFRDKVWLDLWCLMSELIIELDNRLKREKAMSEN
jgi:hypothetical protein